MKNIKQLVSDASLKNIICEKEGLEEVTLTWKDKLKPVTFSTGIKGAVRNCLISANGYRTREYHYSQFGNEWSLR